MWVIKYGDVDTTSDEFTIEDLGEIEKTTGTPWSILNPVREIKVAKAFLATALLRSGKSDEEVALALKTATMHRLKTAFRFVEDPDDETEAGEPDPSPAPSLITPDSSPGASHKGGRPARPAKNDLATS